MDKSSTNFAEVNQDGSGRELQIVNAGPARFAIDSKEIATIEPWQTPTPLPHAPKSVLGVVSIQGRMLTVLSLGALTDSESADLQNHNYSHILALRGDEQLAIAVAGLGEKLKPAVGDFLPKAEQAGSLLPQSLRLDGSEIGVVDVKELFAAAIQGRERRRRRF